MYNILVCDDDKEIVKAVEIYLKGQGYNVLKAYNGLECIKVLEKEEVHLVLLDIMMPVQDGTTTLKQIREKWVMPVIMLTAKSEDMDKIEGLNLGADDYVTKPFNHMELLARVNSQLRRFTRLGSKEKIDTKDVYQTGGLVLDDREKEVSVDGKHIKFTPTEYNILKFLMQNKGEVFSTEKIYNAVWKDDAYATENIIAVHIRHIREKIEINPREPKYLKVIWGIGYKMEEIQ